MTIIAVTTSILLAALAVAGLTTGQFFRDGDELGDRLR